jgi:hypothetical protein
MIMGSPAVSRFIAVALCGICINASASFAQETAPEPRPELGTGAYLGGGAPAEMSADETAKQLANPNTALASLTLKNQWTHWGGSLPGADGLDSQTFLFQPSFPFPVSATDRVFLRPAFPYLVDQPVVDGSGKVRTKSGFGDMGMDLAYGRTTKTGMLFVGGIVAGLPIGQGELSSDTWTLGPELFVGKLTKNSVIGLFPNHQWDVSGPKNISLTTVQPMLSYLPGGGWAISTAGQITYNWEAEQWTIPLNLAVSRTVKLGTLPVKLMLEGNYYLEQADALGQKWMIGFNITPVVRNVLAEWIAGK